MTTLKIPTTAGYIVADNNGTIWAVGETVDAALDYAAAELTGPDGTWAADDVVDAGYRVLSASTALLARVESHGGDIAWHNLGGVAVTQAEYDAAEYV